MMEEFGNRFVPLGEVATVRRGITSGCDAFFMPRDVTQEFLKNYAHLEWNDAPLYTACKRSEVESGRVKLILAGDKTVHPVETRYLAPEVHSLLKVSSPSLSASDLDRFVLHVSEPMHSLKGTYVSKFLHYGETHPFASKKSKAVPVPKRSTCMARDPWYDLTFTKRGHLIWPKAQQYRHVIVYNKHRLIVNCNLYNVTLVDEKTRPPEVFAAVLNSTLVGLAKTYFGRYAGTEGNLKTEVVDVNLLEVPDPRHASAQIATKLLAAFERLCQPATQPMVEDELIDCHSSERAQKLKDTPVKLPAELLMADRRALDLAVLELIGVADPAEREKVCDELYYETANHFRQIRIVEIQKQEQRAGGGSRGFRTDELAANLWDALEDEDKQLLPRWLATTVTDGVTISIPEGRVSLPDATDMFHANTVSFVQPGAAKGTAKELVLPSRAHAEIVQVLSVQGFHGEFKLPKEDKSAQTLKAKLEERLTILSGKALQLAHSRTTDDTKASDIANLLQHWMLHGKPERAGKG